jgi:hypothetical protein
MTELSPAAKAILEMVNAAPHCGSGRIKAAAALRAAADRTEYLIGDNPHPKFAEGVLAAGDLLDHIAAELEGTIP